jgi:hypothetical protein
MWTCSAGLRRRSPPSLASSAKSFSPTAWTTCPKRTSPTAPASRCSESSGTWRRPSTSSARKWTAIHLAGGNDGPDRRTRLASNRGGVDQPGPLLQALPHLRRGAGLAVGLRRRAWTRRSNDLRRAYPDARTQRRSLGRSQVSALLFVLRERNSGVWTRSFKTGSSARNLRSRAFRAASVRPLAAPSLQISASLRPFAALRTETWDRLIVWPKKPKKTKGLFA